MKISKNVIIILLMLFSSVSIIFCIDNGHNWGGDFSLYIAQAKSFVNSSMYELYNSNKYAMLNSIEQNGPYLYPFGFPLLLSLVYSIFGINFIAMKLFCGSFLILSIPIIYNLFKIHFIEKSYLYIILICIALHPAFIMFADNILSDLPFFFFTFLSFLLLTKKNTILNQVILGFSISITYFVRDIGIVLIPTLFVFQLHGCMCNNYIKTRKVLLVIPYIIFAILKFLEVILLPAGNENHYSILFTSISFEQFFDHITYYYNLTSEYFLMSPKFFIIPCIIIFIGALSSWKQVIHFHIFTLSTVIVLLIWPATQGVRFIFPIIPFFFFYLIKGALYLFQKFNFNSKYVVILFYTCIAINSPFALKAIIYNIRYESNQAYTDEMRSIYTFITNNINKDEVVGFINPRVLRLFTDRNSIYIDLNHFEKAGIKYLLIQKPDFKPSSKRYIVLMQTNNYFLISKYAHPLLYQ